MGLIAGEIFSCLSDPERYRNMTLVNSLSACSRLINGTSPAPSSFASGTWTISVETERRIAAAFLFLVVILQFINAFVFFVMSSKGKKGRLPYYIAFFLTVLHDLFIGMLVPLSLVWVGVELVGNTLTIEPLLTTIVGALWYGPERVQQSISNIIRFNKRRKILTASLAAYHRSKVERDVASGSTIVVKYERRLPMIIWRRSHGDHLGHHRHSFIHNHNDHSNTQTKIAKKRSSLVRRAKDTYLRSIARLGVEMAISGHFNDNELRDWYMYLIADQARFSLSPLDLVHPSTTSPGQHTGYGATKMKKCVQEVKNEWTDDQWRRLITVYEGLRHDGSFQYLVEGGWILL